MYVLISSGPWVLSNQTASSCGWRPLQACTCDIMLVVLTCCKAGWGMAAAGPTRWWWLGSSGSPSTRHAYVSGQVRLKAWWKASQATPTGSWIRQVCLRQCVKHVGVDVGVARGLLIVAPRIVSGMTKLSGSAGLLCAACYMC